MPSRDPRGHGGGASPPAWRLGVVRLSRVVAGGALSGQEALPVLSQVEGTGRMTERRIDRWMYPTSPCTMVGCGHVRWRHGPYGVLGDNPCQVTGCECKRGWSFEIAVYEGPDKLGEHQGG